MTNIDAAKMKKKYWFTIETYVHISIKRDSLLLYNSLTGKALKYSGERAVLNLVKRLVSQKNLQVIAMDEQKLDDPVINRFVSDVRGNFMGDLIDASYSREKPLQMMPMVKIQKDVKKLKENELLSVGEGMLKYLTEISLYINSECGENCSLCSSAFKQFYCCSKSKGTNQSLPLKEIKEFITGGNIQSLANIKILGGNIFNYPEFNELIAFLDSLPTQICIYSHYLNVLKEANKLNLLKGKRSSLKILVPFPIDKTKLKNAIDAVNYNCLESEVIFILQDENEFNHAESLISSLNIPSHDFAPYYNGKNSDFFRENIFTTPEDIFEPKPQLKDIYTNTAVNKLNFGRLTILSNGNIHANVNTPRLGIFGKDTVYDVVYKELNSGKNWMRVRRNVSPCKSCTFEALCPPLSNYNHAFGRNNLCNMHH